MNLTPLRDRIKPGARVLFVGINPGIRSSQTGHHFAGYSNRFWKLLFESRLLPEPVTFEDDDRLPAFGFGITNVVLGLQPETIGTSKIFVLPNPSGRNANFTRTEMLDAFKGLKRAMATLQKP